MPLRSYQLFCAAVAFTFATVGVVNDLFDLAPSDLLHLILKIVTTSGFSVLWVIALHRRTPKFIVLLIAIQISWMFSIGRLFPTPHRNLSPLPGVLLEPGEAVTYAVAAHLPILHYQRAGKTVVRRIVENLPVAMFPALRYQSASFNFAEGDILAIVTDGLTEVFNSNNGSSAICISKRLSPGSGVSPCW